MFKKPTFEDFLALREQIPESELSKRYSNKITKSVIFICEILDAKYDGGPFEIASTSFVKPLKTTAQTVTYHMRKLMADGVLIRYTKGYSGVPSMYRLVKNPPPPPPPQEKTTEPT